MMTFVIAALAMVADSGSAQTTPDSETQVSVSPSVIQRFSPGRWGALTVVGRNPGPEDSEEIVSVYVADDSSQQYSTRFLVPAESRRQTWMPVFLPDSTSVEGATVPMTTMRLVEKGGSESLKLNVTNSATTERSLLLTPGEINTALIVNAPEIEATSQANKERAALVNLIEKGRATTISNSMGLPPITFSSAFLPHSYGAFDELDQIVVAGNALRDDTAGMVRIRQWLRGGGRLWIMLDRTDLSIVQELLEGDGELEAIDRTELNQFKLAGLDPFDPTKQAETDLWESEQPVDFLRVVAPETDVIFSLDGWPAAFRKSVGQGEVLFTTLAGQGWLDADGEPTPGMYRLARLMFEPRVSVPSSVDAMKPLVNAKIGYQVPSRSLAAVVLGFNSIALLCAGLWYLSKRRLERMAFIVPLISVAAAGGMFLIGSRNTASVPSTVASTQIVVAHQSTGELEVESTHAVYSQTATPPNLLADASGAIEPIDQGSDGLRRLRINEDGRFRWNIGDQPPGTVQFWHAESTRWNHNRLFAQGTFDEEGFVGLVDGVNPLAIADTVLASFPSVATSVEVTDQSKSSVNVRARSTDRLASEQFVADNLMSDQQRMRQQFLRELSSQAESNFLSRGPQLLFWSEQLPSNLSVPEAFERFTTSLVSVPISLRPPARGTPFKIPATFIETESFAASRGMSLIFDAESGKWMTDVTGSTETDLLFRFPPCLRGLKLTRVSLTLDIEAPQRTVQIKAWVDDQPVSVYSDESPAGTSTFTLDDETALSVAEHDGLRLTLSVSLPDGMQGDDQSPQIVPPSNPSNGVVTPQISTTNKTWQVNELILDAEAILE
ncbi:MAG: hypothetical protein AAFV88_02730 [Planctomycetota bacterium]